MSGVYLSYGNLKLDIENPCYDDKILSEIGQKQALDMCNLLIKKYGAPSLIICSPYERTRIMSIILKNRIKIKQKKDIHILVDNNLSKYWSQSIQKTNKEVDISDFTKNYNPMLKESRYEFIQRVKNHLKKFGKKEYLSVIKQILNNLEYDENNYDENNYDKDDIKNNNPNIIIKNYLENELKKNYNEKENTKNFIWYVTHPIFIRQVANELNIVPTLDVNTWIYPNLKKYGWKNDKSMLLLPSSKSSNIVQSYKKNYNNHHQEYVNNHYHQEYANNRYCQNNNKQQNFEYNQIVKTPLEQQQQQQQQPSKYYYKNDSNFNNIIWKIFGFKF